MENIKQPGRITTFYSFKGGVGRTMALANVAYIAARNGQRVLAMDWDLEAPGLTYYSRGLMDSTVASLLENAPGVLDFLWDWRNGVTQCKAKEDLDALKERFASGYEFSRCAIRLDEYQGGGALDVISAGRRTIAAPGPVPYEDALAKFSWQHFFDEEAGGFVLDKLREWAKDRYDLILIDSRTGLADTAGVCTMQLPDQVALCFVLNRQNIDGTARVAGAIQGRRGEEIQLRTVPMRVARSETSEEASARAYAQANLRRIGKIDQQIVEHDFRNLAINAFENVPFTETLAPFNTPDPTVDPLTLQYVRLAKNLFQRDYEVPGIDSTMLETARIRLKPHLPAIDYLTDTLRHVEPERAIAELPDLLDSAVNLLRDGSEPLDSFVSVLHDLVMNVFTWVCSEEQDFQLQGKLIELMRLAADIKPQTWNVLYQETLEQHINDFGYRLGDWWDSAVAAELDRVRASIPTVDNQIKRIATRRSIAKLLVASGRYSQAHKWIADFTSLADILDERNIQGTLQGDIVLAAKVDAKLLAGDISAGEGDSDQALTIYQRAIQLFDHVDMSRMIESLDLLRETLHVRLADEFSKAGSKYLAAQNAVEAIRWHRDRQPMVGQFVLLTRILLDAVSEHPELLQEYCSLLLKMSERSQRLTIIQNVSTMNSVLNILQVTTELAGSVVEFLPKGARNMLQWLAKFIDFSLRTLTSRPGGIGTEWKESIFHYIVDFCLTLERAGLSVAEYTHLNTARKLAQQGNDPEFPIEDWP